jgi:ABC transport system ATP-binding/permease protein
MFLSLPKEEFTDIESFVVNNDPKELDYPSVLSIHDKPEYGQHCKHIHTEALHGYLYHTSNKERRPLLPKVHWQ